MRRSAKMLFLLVLAAVSTVATAAPLRFNAVGEVNVSGYVQFDDTNLLFDGSCESNAYITDLDLRVVVGPDTIFFTEADVITGDDTVLITLNTVPMIDNGCGDLATVGDWTIGFWPDGWGGSPTDGDAALRVENRGATPVDVSYAVQWVIGFGSPIPVPTLANWSLVSLILLAGFIGAAFMRRRARV